MFLGNLHYLSDLLGSGDSETVPCSSAPLHSDKPLAAVLLLAVLFVREDAQSSEVLSHLLDLLLGDRRLAESNLVGRDKVPSFWLIGDSRFHSVLIN